MNVLRPAIPSSGSCSALIGGISGGMKERYFSQDLIYGDRRSSPNTQILALFEYVANMGNAAWAYSVSRTDIFRQS